MLTRPEYHKLKSLEAWAQEAQGKLHQAWLRLAELIKAHDHQCGAVDVATTFTPATAMAVQSMAMTVNGLCMQDDHADPDKLDKDFHEQLVAGLETLEQELAACHSALNGLASAYLHMGHGMAIPLPPAAVYPPAEEGERPYLDDPVTHHEPGCPSAPEPPEIH